MSKWSQRTNRVTQEMRDNKMPLVQQCVNDPEKPCSRTHIQCGMEGDFCTVYQNPAAMWRRGDCPMADNHLRKNIEEPSTKNKVRVGQQKQKKRR